MRMAFFDLLPTGHLRTVRCGELDGVGRSTTHRGITRGRFESPSEFYCKRGRSLRLRAGSCIRTSRLTKFLTSWVLVTVAILLEAIASGLAAAPANGGRQESDQCSPPEEAMKSAGSTVSSRYWRPHCSLFVSKGYENATIDTIAAEAGLTKGAVYFYFKGKAALLHALLDDAEAALRRHFCAT